MINGVVHQIKNLWNRRDLIKYFVKTDLKIIYKNKLFGFLWAIFDPLMMMAVYIILVVFIFRRGGPQFPILLFTALLSWRWFIYSLSGAVTSVQGKGKLIQSVLFPKAVLPFSRVVVGMINFFFGLAVLIPLLFFFHANISWNICWLPVVILIQFFLTAGAALICATLGVYFHDMENIIQYGLRLWFYLSPGLYAVADRIPDRFVPIYMLNPFAALFNSYKNILVYGTLPSGYLIFTALLAIVFFIFGLVYFNSKEPDFAKVV